MKATYIIFALFFSSFCITQARTPESQSLWNEYVKIRHLINTEALDNGLAILEQLEQKDLSKYPDIQSQLFFLKAHCFRQMDQLDSVQVQLDRAEYIINEHALDSIKANLYRQRGLSYWDNLDFDSSIPFFLTGLRIAENFENVREQIMLCLSISNAYSFTLKTDSSRIYAHRALNIAIQEKDLINKANCNRLLGRIEASEGNFLKAMEFFFESFRQAKIIQGDTEQTRIKYIANPLVGMYFNLGNLHSSLAMTNLIVDEKSKSKRIYNIEAHLLTKASLLMRMDSIESSTAVMEELERSHKVSENPSYHNQVVAVKGGLLYKKEQWAAAEDELSKLILEVDSSSHNFNFDGVVFQGISHLAKLKLRKGDFQESISICKKQLNNGAGHDHRKQFYGTLAACHKALGNHSIAYNYLLMKDMVRDTIDRFYESTLRLSKEQEMLDQQKVEEIAKLQYVNELSQDKAAKQRNLIIVGCIIALLISGLLYLWGRQRKLAYENTLVDVKQQLLRMQINPHFIFNSLNSIQNSVLTFRKEKSIELISKFSKLMRQILQNSDNEKVSIQEELLLLTNYMDLEKIRTRDKFDYEVEIDDTIDIHNDEIPTMILQLFVENSIWHGIIPKEGRGLIKVKIEKENDGINVIIDDDGIGRTLSANYKTEDQKEKVSMGIKLIKQRIQTLNKKYRSNIAIHIHDGMNGIGTQARLST